ncbi:MAG: hypothetical protein OEZ01_10565, partial [Candidatus Heimdallarchaeota archaeon]|nr:hypothetical protein [Candidatus Heimdallarchaeota archaeon]
MKTSKQNNQEISLTSFSYNITKWSGKTTFYLFIIGLIMIAITVNDGQPITHDYQFNETGRIIDTFDTQGQNIQISYFVVNDQNSIILVDIILLNESGYAEETIFSHEGSQHFSEKYFGEGRYQVVVSTTEYTEFVFTRSTFNYSLVFLVAVIFSLFGIFMSIFSISFITTLIILIINALTPKDEKIKTKNYNQSIMSIPTDKKSIPAKNTSRQPIIKMRNNSQSSIMNSNSFIFQKLTKNDWILISFGTLFFILNFFEKDSPFFVMSLILFVVTIYFVTEREKTKEKIMNILESQGETTLQQLVSFLDKKENHLEEVIQILILDDAQPILYDFASKTLKLTKHIPIQTQNNEITDNTTRTVADQKENVDSKNQILMSNDYCTGCGTQ